MQPWAIALTAATLPLAAGPAWAEPLDARALGLAGHYAAYANSDVNGTEINPALLAQQRGWIYLGPNLGLGLGNNAIGASSMQDFATYGKYLSDYMGYSQKIASDPAAQAPSEVDRPTTISKLASDGLTLSLGTEVGLLGLRLPLPSLLGLREEPELTTGGDAATEPGLQMGAMGVRVWGVGGVDLSLSAPTVMDAVFNLPKLDQSLVSDLKDLKSALQANDISPATIGAKVNQLRTTLSSEAGLGAFRTERSVQLTAVNRAYATAAFSASQPVPMFPLPFFPHPKATVGATYKLFAAPGNVSQMIGDSVQGLPKDLPIGSPGSLTLKAGVKFADQLNALDTALDTVSKDFSKVADLGSQLSSFGNLDYNKALDLTATSKSASSIGSGVDLGAVIDLNDTLSLGASLVNPLVIWPGTQQTLVASFANGTPAFTAQGAATQINFTDSEPMALDVGGAMHLPLGFNLMGDYVQSFNGMTPAVQAGLEWNIFNFLYARAGARTHLDGSDKLVSAGLGLNLFITKLDLAAAADPELKSFNAAVSWGLGF